MRKRHVQNPVSDSLPMLASCNEQLRAFPTVLSRPQQRNLVAHHQPCAPASSPVEEAVLHELPRGRRHAEEVLTSRGRDRVRGTRLHCLGPCPRRHVARRSRRGALTARARVCTAHGVPDARVTRTFLPRSVRILILSAHQDAAGEGGHERVD